MTSPSPNSYEPYVFLPLAALKLQEKTIADFKRKEAAAPAQLAPQHYEGYLDGKGAGTAGADGVPGDLPGEGNDAAAPLLKKNGHLEASVSAAAGGIPAYLPKYHFEKPDEDSDMPKTVKKLPGKVFGEGLLPGKRSGDEANAQAQNLEGGSGGGSSSNDIEKRPRFPRNEEEMGDGEYPFYIGMYNDE
jgi:hypothetical protein